MDRLEAMSLLVAVVESGSLSAAGRKLGVPLPTVSRKISDLEAHLKARLLSVRRAAWLSPTPAQRMSPPQSASSMKSAKPSAQRLETYASPKGDLVITAPVVFGRLHVLPVVVDFLGDGRRSTAIGLV